MAADVEVIFFHPPVQLVPTTQILYNNPAVVRRFLISDPGLLNYLRFDIYIQSVTTRMYTEQSLLSAIRHKDLKAFRFFYDKYAPSLNGHMLAYSMDSGCCNELLQQVFIKAWKDIDAYDPDKGRLYTWLLNMAMVIHKSGTGQNGYLPERVFMPQLY